MLDRVEALTVVSILTNHLYDRHISVALARYLRWYVYLSHPTLIYWVLCPFASSQSNVTTRLGVKTRIFHLGDYRRATIPFGEDMPDDYFYVNGQ